MTGAAIHYQTAWAERQRGFRDRTERIALPILTTLMLRHIKQGYPIPVCYSVLPVHYLHMLFLKTISLIRG